MAKSPRRVRSLTTVAFEDLQAEFRRRQKSVSGLQIRYKKAAAKAAALARQIEAMGGSVNGPAGRASSTRSKNDRPLSEYLLEALKGKELRIPEIIAAVQGLGYKSNASSFRPIVSLALAKTTGIKRVSRGVYTAK